MADKVSALLINGNDAWETYGIKMGNDFLDSLNAFPTMKDYIENTSRLEHGKRVMTTNVKVDSATVSLTFLLEGTSQDDFKTKRAAFMEVLVKGEVTIQVPKDSDDVYHLIYKKGTSYAQNYQRTFCKIVCSFEEPNPMNRTKETGESST